MQKIYTKKIINFKYLENVKITKSIKIKNI